MQRVELLKINFRELAKLAWCKILASKLDSRGGPVSVHAPSCQRLGLSVSHCNLYILRGDLLPLEESLLASSVATQLNLPT